MSEQVSKMIDALDKDDNLEAEIQFKSALTDKVGDVLDTKEKVLTLQNFCCKFGRSRNSRTILLKHQEMRMSIAFGSTEQPDTGT